MKEVPATDSGYPTPREPPLSSRSGSPVSSPTENWLTSTPILGAKSRSITSHFPPRHDLSVIESTGSDSVSPADVSNNALEEVKTVLAVSKEIKRKDKELGDLRQEQSMLREKNETLRNENESLREENISLREESKQFEPENSQYTSPKENVLIPNVELHMDSSLTKEQITASESIKRKFEEEKLKLIADLEKKLKESQEKLALSEVKVDDLKNKLQTSHDKLSRSGEKAAEVQARLNNKRKQLDEVKAENCRLLEDQKTHEFELDEVKINAEVMEKKKKIAEEKVEQLQASLEKVQKLLEEEKLANAETKKDLIRTEQNYENELSKLNKKVEEALARESEVNTQLETVRAENKELTKENKYLTESRQKLIESEMNLKNDVSVQSVNLRDQENQLIILKEQISKKERQYHELETKSSDLETLNKKLNEDKYESEELLSELQKKQQEIDHLRQKVSQLQAQDSEQMNFLNEKIKEYMNKENHLKEELNDVKRQEREAKTKLDEYIGTQAEKATTEYKKLSEEVAELKETIQSITEKAVQKELQVVKLEKELETKRNEFEDFKFHANLQYENEITEKEQQISNLRSRLVELETYPGKVVSISRKAASVQTDEVVEEKEPVPVSMFEERDVSKNVTLVSEESVDADFKRRMTEEENERMKEMLKEKEELAEKRYDMACQFKELFESEERQHLEALADHKRQTTELRGEIEKLERKVVELETKPGKVVSISRKAASVQTDEVVEKKEPVPVSTVYADYKRQIAELRGEIKKLERKRADDKETMLSIIESADITAKKCYYLKGRNTERQKLLNHAKKAVEELCALKINENSKRKLDKFIELTEQSGLLDSDDIDAAVRKADRRVLGSVNKEK